MTNKKDIGFDLPLLTKEKVEEIRLSAFLGAAYQRLLMVDGEISRMETEVESLPSYSAHTSDEFSEEAQHAVAHRIMVQSYLSRALREKESLESRIKEQTT